MLKIGEVEFERVCRTCYDGWCSEHGHYGDEPETELTEEGEALIRFIRKYLFSTDVE
jgi:hypothetical protein